VSIEHQKLTLGDVVSAAGLAIGLVTAWLYAAGWIYAYVYFDRFRIPLLMLDIPFEHFLVYGGLAVRKDLWFVLVCAVLVIAVLGAVAYWSSRLGRFAVSTIVVLLIIVAFALARGAGSSAALADFAGQRSTDYSAYPRVRVTWEGAHLPPDSLTGDILKTDCGRLLAVSKDRLFLIRPVRSASGLDLDTFILSGKAAVAVRIIADYTSCP
jgi:hypothetical protein